MVKIEVRNSDAFAVEADILALKFAQGLHGVDGAAAERLIDGGRQPVWPPPGEFRLERSVYGIAASNVLFVGVPPLDEFEYSEIRKFSRKVLSALAAEVPEARQIAMTLHGIGYGLDEIDAFDAEIAGLLDGLKSGNFPPSLKLISIVERDEGRSRRLQRRLDELLPTGATDTRPSPVTRKGKPNQEVHVFISYAREDQEKARSIWRLLTARNYSAWMDTESLVPGQNWKLEIKQAIQSCAAFLACLSANSISKRGHVQAELKEALEVFKTIPEGNVFLIPVRLEPCTVPSVFEELQWVDFFSPEGPSKLLAGIAHILPPLPSEVRAVRSLTSHSAPGRLTIAEWAVLNELNGKPDVRWTADIVAQSIRENKPQLANRMQTGVPEAIASLVRGGYLRTRGSHIEVTNKAINYYAEQSKYSTARMKY